MKKQLFQITDLSTRNPVPGLFFSDKQTAKVKRRELNGVDENGKERLKYIVSPGPDHTNYHARRS